ncbi:uncharacterized protein At4g18490 isoform X2 [Daucus carota subsp. sativus]|uniref:uncharacterized protein At4g18490 isoform X2 n=1 Tax=Daucus carota subsp. sativus TaxID=79200 RepID=UPI0007EF342E|nr:PREDICTED: uncharacterized protein At4g18490-like [Daucus carota subsp. sativus]
MAEKQKESLSSAKSKEKTALFDLDIGKDFLTSWKSMGEDDQMDFDFSTVAKGNKKPFKFDNMDMDFKLDDDFGKISSFNVDMSDLDVSSPVKKTGKPSGKSKEVSAEKKTQGKSDRSTFQFDFDGFDDFNFGPSSGKISKQTNANQDAARSPSLSGSLGFGTHFKETIGASEGDATSKFDSQLGGEPNSLSKEKSHTSLTDVQMPSKSEVAKDEATNLVGPISPQKPICGSTNETDHEKCEGERSTQQEPDKETCQNLSLLSLSENSSSHQIPHNPTEEVGCLVRKESTYSDSEQSISGEKTDIGFKSGNLHLDKLPVDIACSQSNDGENSEFSGDNPVLKDNNDDAEPAQSGTQIEQTSTTTASKKMLHEIETDGETMNVTSELVATPSDTMDTIIEATGDKELPGPKRVKNVVRSKYFKGSDEAKLQVQQSSVTQINAAAFDRQRIQTFQLSPADEGATMVDKAMPVKESLPTSNSESFQGDETKSQLQQASLSQVKIGTISSQKITISQQSSAIENININRKSDKKDSQTGSKLGALPRPSTLPSEQTNSGSVGIRSQKSSSNLISKRGSLNTVDTRKILNNRSRLQDMDVTKGFRTGSKSEDLDKFRKLDNQVAKTGRILPVLPKATSREQIEGCSVQIRSQGIPKDLTTNGEGYISDNSRTLKGMPRLHDKDAAKGEPASSGSGKNVKDLNTISLHVEPSSSNEQANASALLLGQYPRLPLSGMQALQNNIVASENQKVPDLKDGFRTSAPFKLNNLRTTEKVQSPSNSTLQKDPRLVTNSRQGVDLKENTGSRMGHTADTRKKASSSPTLKRKEIEDSSASLPMLKPTKRLLKSPSGSSDVKELLENFVDREHNCDGNTENGLSKSLSSFLHFPQEVHMNELETILEIDNDTNVEIAQACAKELDDLANMLKKKHEEAKEILVRAVVNNNKLLMLNHPIAIHEKKAHLIEEFAALLLSK